MDRGKERYTIGEIAKICNVTKKQLRYYDENKIVCPYYKDESTNYRYYNDIQIEEILLLKELKQLDLPLRDIADILQERNIPLFRQKIQKQMETAKNDMIEAVNRYDQTVQTFVRVCGVLETLKGMEDRYSKSHEYKLVTYPGKKVVYTRYLSRWNANKLFIDRRAEIYQLIDEYQLMQRGVLTAVFRDGYMRQFSEKAEDAKGDLEVFFEIDSEKNCSCFRDIKTFEAVSTIHVGSYPSLEEVYRELQEWAVENGYELEDTSMEEYICGSTMTSDESKYVTRIYVPLKGNEV